MQIRFRISEHLMRSMLELQAAMMTAMTQMQHAFSPGRCQTPSRPEQRLASRRSNQNKPAARPTSRLRHQLRLRLLKGGHQPRGGPAAQPTKPKSSWFEGRGEGHHLSPEGVKHLRSLFNQGLSQSEAARRMGITPAAVRRRFREWSGKQAA